MNHSEFALNRTLDELEQRYTELFSRFFIFYIFIYLFNYVKYLDNSYLKFSMGSY